MATGDTVPGRVAVYKVKRSGSTPKVAGPYRQSAVDTFGESAENKLYLNTSVSDSKSSPLQAQDRTVLGAEFSPGEKVRLEHETNNDTGRSIDTEADEFAIGAVEIDMNEPQGSPDRVFPTTLTVADNELTGTVTESESGAIFFETTVPDRTRILLAGAFEVAAVEA